jgi:hypothetical protein
LSLDKYLKICEQLNQEPDPDKMPLETSDFPEQVQVAFFVFDNLSDVWEGMSGSYLGKNWSDAEYVMNLYEVEEPKVVYYFAKMYERILMGFKAEESEKKRKADEKRQTAGGKNFTHNVKG